MSDLPTVTSLQLAELDGQAPIDLIDVRTPAEFGEVRAAIARNVPLTSLDPHSVMKARNGTANDPLYVICKSGSRGAKACDKFIAAGYRNVVNVDGGTEAWDRAGLPVIRGKKTMSLERQVRISAGLIVLVSSLLAMTVQPLFAGVAGFMGAGLMFAAIIDSCAMGMVLAKMPWNQVKDDSQCCTAK